MKTTPLLSICIPTYNRAHLLESALYALAPQVKALTGQVELIVSDNCSPDQTPQVVERARDWGPIQYYRNEENVGIINFDLCVKRAAGEFVWLVGDDDLVREDGVQRVLRVLQDQPEVDFVFVNASVGVKPEEREQFGRLVSGKDFPELQPTKCANLTDHPVDRWEELIDPQIDSVFLGSVMCSVFRRALWLANRSRVNVENWYSLTPESVYLHSVIFAHAMVGRPAWYIGYPCVIAFWGYQEFSGSGYVPAILLVTLHQLLDVYLQVGVEGWRIERCRRALLRGAGRPLMLMLLKPHLPGRKLFSFRRYFSRYGHYKELWIGLLLSLAPGAAKRQIVKLIRQIHRPVVSG